MRVVLKGQLQWRRAGAGAGARGGSERETTGQEAGGRYGEGGRRSPELKSTGTRTGKDTRHWTERDRHRAGAEGQEKSRKGEEEGEEEQGRLRAALGLGYREDLGMAG